MALVTLIAIAGALPLISGKRYSLKHFKQKFHSSKMGMKSINRVFYDTLHCTDWYVLARRFLKKALFHAPLYMLDFGYF